MKENKTTLRKLIEEIDFDNEKLQCSPGWEELGAEFDIHDLFWSDDDRLKAYFIKTWYCTDSWVGWRAYFLDNELVCVSSQQGRKCDENFEFISKEKAEKVLKYIQSLKREEDDPLEHIAYLDDKELDEEINNTYKVEYSSQILHKSGLHNGIPVEIIKTYHDYKHFHEVVVRYPDKKEKEIDCRELDFKFNTLE